MSSRTLHHKLAGARWNAARAYVLDRDEYVCWICGGEDANEADHIIPLSHMTQEQWDEGLPWDTNNLKASHKTCNGRRSNKVEARQAWINTKWLDSL